MNVFVYILNFLVSFKELNLSRKLSCCIKLEKIKQDVDLEVTN